ncbi:MAG: ABC transporter substrate-binding protein [Chloroflexi bacterium]|nr:ABC transporter substrate-binding protein [Chloroflexota bacterium]
MTASALWSRPSIALKVAVALGLLAAVACGAQETSPTPTSPPSAPTATNTPPPTSTSAPSQPTPTAPGAAATPTPTATATPKPAPAVKPKRGGVLRGSSTDDPPTFDISMAASSAFSIHTAKMHNGLLWNPDGRSVAPDAAESYSVSGDGKVWTFKLHSNIRWQSYPDNPGPRDGTLMTARDAAYSLKYMMGVVGGKTSERCGWMKEFVDIDRPDSGVVAVDDLTLQVHMTQPFPEFANVLVLTHCSLFPEGTTSEMFAKRPYGSGPYRLKSFLRGAEWVYARNPDYFQKDQPYIDEQRIMIIQGGAAITNVAFLTGRLDIGGGRPTPDNRPLYDRMVAQGKISLNERLGTTAIVYGVYMNSTRPPFSNPRLRKAVHLALDRKGYIESVYDGDAVPLTYVPTGKLPWFRTEEEVWKMPGYRLPKDQDLAEAKRIMAELYPSGLDFEMPVRNTGDYPTMAEYDAGELKKIGIRTTIKLMSTAQLYDTLSKCNYDITSYGMTMITMTTAELFGSYYITGGSRNWLCYSEPKIDALFPKLVAAEGEAKAALVKEVEKILWDFIPWAPMAGSLGNQNYYSYVQNWPLTNPDNGFSNYSHQRYSLVWRSDV